MTIKEPRLRSLLTQADRNASYGKNAAAESIYRQILGEAPDAEEAWLGLAEVVFDPDEKRSAYERALALAPETPLAIAGLARLDGRPVPPEIEAALAAAEEAREADNPQPVAVATVEDVLVEHNDEAAAYELACYRHPDRSTSLRCYNCNRPICISCANKTPVGYICPECQREAEDAFFNNKPLDYLIAVLVSLPISLLAGYLIGLLTGGFLFFLIIFFVSGAIGGFIGRITKRAVGGRRGRYLPGLVVAMMILGAILPALLSFVMGGGISLFGLLGVGIYLFVAGGAAYWQMR
jgi:hypothetical protein